MPFRSVVMPTTHHSDFDPDFWLGQLIIKCYIWQTFFEISLKLTINHNYLYLSLELDGYHVE